MRKSKPSPKAPKRKCDHIRSKCVFTPLLASIAKAQSSGDPGSLGPVKAFLGPKFFDQFDPTTHSLRSSVSRCVLRNFSEFIVHGDVHGDLLAFLAVLFEAGFIDKSANYIPPKSERTRRCVVALGDVLDRGGRGDVSRDSAKLASEELVIIEFAFALDAQARKNGERVLLLSGNHEMRALTGDEEFTTASTANPYGVPRAQIFSRPGALAYFALERPVMAVTDGGWLFAHGDFQAKPLRAFLEVNQRMLQSLQISADLRCYEAVSVACNAMWAAWVLSRGGLHSLGRRLAAFSHVKATQEGLQNGSGRLDPFADSVLHGRSLSKLGDCQKGAPACQRSVGEIQRMLGLDWTFCGGIALGHTIQAHLDDACGGTVYLTDVGMSEGFFGVNGSPVAFLHITEMERVVQIEVSGKTGKRKETVAQES